MGKDSARWGSLPRGSGPGGSENPLLAAGAGGWGPRGAAVLRGWAAAGPHCPLHARSTRPGDQGLVHHQIPHAAAVGWRLRPGFWGWRGGGRRVGAEAGIPPGFGLPAGVESRVIPVPGPQGQPSSLPLPPRPRPHSPGRPPRYSGTGASARAAGTGPRVWLLCRSTSSRSLFPPLVTAGHRCSLWPRWGAPHQPATGSGPFAPLLRLLSPCLPPAPGVYSCPQWGWGQEGPAHLLGGATAHHTVPRGASPVWRTRLNRHLPAAGPGAALGQEGPTNPDLALRLRPNPLTCLPSTRSSR